MSRIGPGGSVEISSGANSSLSVNIPDQRRASQVSRSNPFDSQIHHFEDHYACNLDERMADTDVSDLNINAELGLANSDHYSSEATFGQPREEELQVAIDLCKQLIKDCDETSPKRRKLVKKLIELRIQLHELKEGLATPVDVSKQICGHKFSCQEGHRSSRYCERCNYIIWSSLQSWFKCDECGYCCHEKCLMVVIRQCAAVRAKDAQSYNLKLCPERGLASQNYRCVECKAKLSFLPGAGSDGAQEPRLCDYSGLYYCPSCHWNDAMVIPGRVVHNWDFTPAKVCRADKQFLRLMHAKPVIHLEALNPVLFDYVEELRLVKRMRSDILLIKCYFLCCKNARKDRLLVQASLFLKARNGSHCDDFDFLFHRPDNPACSSPLVSADSDCNAKLHKCFTDHFGDSSTRDLTLNALDWFDTGEEFNTAFGNYVKFAVCARPMLKNCSVPNHHQDLMRHYGGLCSDEPFKAKYDCIRNVLTRKFRHRCPSVPTRSAICEQSNDMLHPRQHFVETADMYSLQDLIQIHDGVLQQELSGVLEGFIRHIKQECEVCRGNGFICEICTDKNEIFPFDDYISICRQCFAVYHRLCFDKKRRQCPRCDRRRKRTVTLNEQEDEEEGSSSPERTLATKTHIANNLANTTTIANSLASTKNDDLTLNDVGHMNGTSRRPEHLRVSPVPLQSNPAQSMPDVHSTNQLTGPDLIGRVALNANADNNPDGKNPFESPTPPERTANTNPFEVPSSANPFE